MILEMSRDLIVIERTSYTVVDLLSDVGGLQGILISAMTFVLRVFNNSHLSSYMVARLFRYKLGAALESRTFEVSRSSYFKHLCIESILPRRLKARCRCCRSSMQHAALLSASRELQ